jgi:hypothetical protein
MCSYRSIAGAFITPPSLHVEAETAGRIPTFNRLRNGSELFTDQIIKANVGSGVGAGIPANRCLIYIYNVSQMFDSQHTIVVARDDPAVVEDRVQLFVENVID